MKRGKRKEKKSKNAVCLMFRNPVPEMRLSVLPAMMTRITKNLLSLLLTPAKLIHCQGNGTLIVLVLPRKSKKYWLRGIVGHCLLNTISGNVSSSMHCFGNPKLQSDRRCR
ncbi:hypothetical protein CEXT_382091 [Caerostris extrusa]|uniref:Uncharacterized protein n=1 Tax=Caerostris extrusa TaxID=172846 RepID=A0AAV4VIX5_CAEEX|nr:hypothetical protein CEXT_382091 [Caerostris extrusa]